MILSINRIVKLYINVHDYANYYKKHDKDQYLVVD